MPQTLFALSCSSRLGPSLNKLEVDSQKKLKHADDDSTPVGTCLKNY